MKQPYYVPAETTRDQITVENSRFITSITRAESTNEARRFLAAIRDEMPDASHHVYAFRIGYGNSVTEGMSDDGEPPGTAGPPVLAVLRGTEIGDIIVVVTRYFGGIKLGTGGLVRAYSAAAREALNKVRLERKIATQTIGLETPYSLYEAIKRLISHHLGRIDDESFLADVLIVATLPVDQVAGFMSDLRELSAGQIEPVLFTEN